MAKNEDKYAITDVIGNEKEEDNYIEETEVENPLMKIIAIYVTLSEEYISSLQFELSDLKSGIMMTSLLGHKTNRDFSFGIDEDDYIRSIRVYYDMYFIHGIIFETMNGKHSPLYGAQTLDKKVIVINNDKEELISFGGTYGNHITSIYFVKRKKNEIGKDIRENEVCDELPEEYKEMLKREDF